MPDQAATPLAEAERALMLTGARPEEARERAIAVLRGEADEEARVVAIRALGHASHELGSVDTAVHHLRRAVRRADHGQLPRRAAQARMTLAGLLTDRGDPWTALAEMDRAAQVLTGADAGRLLGQRAFVLVKLGHFDEALACCQQAIPRIRRAGDARFEAGLLLNRSVLSLYRGRIRRAESDLRRCLDVAAGAGLDHIAALALNNLAYPALRRGDIPRALALLDEAEHKLAGAEVRSAFASVDRADALLRANLVAEARGVLATAIERIENGGYLSEGAEARVTLATAELRDGVPREAVETARGAYRAFVRQRRIGWAHLAEHMMVLARWQRGERSTRLLQDALDSTANLARWGWAEAVALSRITTGRLALELGELELANRELAEAGRARRHGSVHVRVSAWHATALQRLAAGDRRGASAALRAGLRVVDEHAGSMGATDLRVHAVGWGRELAALGMHLALTTGRARSVFGWMERWRAGATRHRPVRPPSDPRLATALTELRQVTADLGSAAAEGRGLHQLRSRQISLEDEIRRRCRHAQGTYQGPRPEPSIGALAAALGDRAFVSYGQHEGRLAAVTIVDGRARLTRLCGYGEALQAMEALRFCIHRLARRHGSVDSLAAARAGVAHAGSRLHRLLIEPLTGHIGERELVLAPTGQLHAIPWSALPSLTQRPLTVTPSAAVWLDARRADRRRGSGQPLLVAGPDLAHADAEVAALAGCYRSCRRLAGPVARAETVHGLLDDADLAHLATHGRFRADNPLFSSIALQDGPLMVYDMERLRRAPRRMVLSSCDAAVSAVRPGDELMGLASALLSLGTATLVASVSPVHDDETRELMVAFHTALASGSPPAPALAEATRTSGVLGFTCFGAG